MIYEVTGVLTKRVKCLVEADNREQAIYLANHSLIARVDVLPVDDGWVNPDCVFKRAKLHKAAKDGAG